MPQFDCTRTLQIWAYRRPDAHLASQPWESESHRDDWNKAPRERANETWHLYSKLSQVIKLYLVPGLKDIYILQRSMLAKQSIIGIRVMCVCPHVGVFLLRSKFSSTGKIYKKNDKLKVFLLLSVLIWHLLEVVRWSISACILIICIFQNHPLTPTHCIKNSVSDC